MLYCPNCKAEYRDGFTKCADCDVDLVDTLPQELDTENVKHGDRAGAVKPQPELGQEVVLKTVDNLVELSYITSELEENDIPYRVMEQGMGQYLSIYVGTSFMGKTIYVDRKNYAKAMEITASYKANFIKSDE